jgi:tetratricopeptide (TPR) repeat protein
MHDLLKNLGKNNIEMIDKELGPELCRIERIPALVTGSFVQAGETFATDVKIVDVKTKNLLKSASAKGDGVASILKEQINDLSREISKGIGLTESKIKETARPIAEVTTTSMGAYNYFLRGREEYEKRYYDDAIQFLEQAAKLDTAFAMVYLYLSRAYYALGNTHARDTNIRKAKSLADKATEKERLYIEASYTSIIERNPEKRFDILQKIAKKYPKEKRVHLYLGSYYDGQKLYYKAIQNFEQALVLAPNYGDAFNGLAYTYIDLGNFEKAIEYLNRYASASPGDVNPFDSMGDLYFRMGKLDQALIKYEEAIAIKPDYFLFTYFKIMYIYALQENYAHSIKVRDQLITLYPGTDRSTGGAGALAWKGILHFWLGNQDETMRDLDKALDMWKSVGNQYFISIVDLMKAWNYFDQGFIEHGLAAIRRWYDFNLLSYPAYTSNISARYNFYLGLVALQQGEIDSAKSRLDYMRLLFPKITPGIKDEIMYFINLLHAEILFAKDSIENAIIVYEKIVPSGISSMNAPALAGYNYPFIHASLRDGLARAYLRKGEIDKAITEYKRLITFDPKSKDRRLIHPKYHYRLAKLYEEKGWADKATKEYEKFIDIYHNADDDLPELIDPKERLVSLREEN